MLFQEEVGHLQSFVSELSDLHVHRQVKEMGQPTNQGVIFPYSIDWTLEDPQGEVGVGL